MRRRRRPAHARALSLSYETYLAANDNYDGCWVCRFLGEQGKLTRGCKRWDRDHDHKTGQPRGLLCRKHNRQLRVWLTLELSRAFTAYLERAA